MAFAKSYYSSRYKDVLKVVLARYYNLKQARTFSWDKSDCVSNFF